MSTTTPISTEFLVLRKTPYSDTSLVVAGISPEHGQLHFMVRGALKLGRRQFPIVDVFRLLTVQFRPVRGELHTWSSAELTTDFSAVARDMDSFARAGWLAQFALANVFGGVAQPRFFLALLVALRRLSASGAAPDGGTPRRRAAVLGACLVFLDESGLLSDYAHDPVSARQCQDLLAMGMGEIEMPRLTSETWERLDGWLRRVMLLRECKLPE